MKCHAQQKIRTFQRGIIYLFFRPVCSTPSIPCKTTHRSATAATEWLRPSFRIARSTGTSMLLEAWKIVCLIRWNIPGIFLHHVFKGTPAKKKTQNDLKHLEDCECFGVNNALLSCLFYISLHGGIHVCVLPICRYFEGPFICSRRPNTINIWGPSLHRLWCRRLLVQGLLGI